MREDVAGGGANGREKHGRQDGHEGRRLRETDEARAEGGDGQKIDDAGAIAGTKGCECDPGDNTRAGA